MRVHANTKDFAMSGKPGIGSAAVVVDADRSHAVDDAERLAVVLFCHDQPGVRDPAGAESRISLGFCW